MAHGLRRGRSNRAFAASSPTNRSCTGSHVGDVPAATQYRRHCPACSPPARLRPAIPDPTRANRTKEIGRVGRVRVGEFRTVVQVRIVWFELQCEQGGRFGPDAFPAHMDPTFPSFEPAAEPIRVSELEYLLQSTRPPQFHLPGDPRIGHAFGRHNSRALISNGFSNTSGHPQPAISR